MPPVSVPQAFTLALQHHQAGRLTEAESIYRQILALQPNHAEALHYLGVIAHQLGRHDLAVEWIRRSIALSPNNAAAQSNLGAALAGHGQFDDAVTSFRRALHLKPDDPSSHNNLGAALARQNQFAAAAEAYRQALAYKPDYLEASFNLGLALSKLGQLDEAAAAYRRALQLKPDYPEAHASLGVVLAGQGRLDEALAAYRQALTLGPNQPEVLSNLGIALAAQDRIAEAVAAYRQALQLQPDYAEAHCHLGIALARQGEFDEALASHDAALRLNPELVVAHQNRGFVLWEQGRVDEASAAYRRAMQIQPEDPVAHSCLLFSLHFNPACDHRTIAGEHAHWNRQFAEPLRKLRRPHANSHDPERRLRIGYVSPNFTRHVICHFLTPLLEAHDKARFEIYCYASVPRPDEVTERLQKSAEVWRDVLALGDDALAERIREDQIDILVDLNLHMAKGRLLTFARKPAPVQVSWLGYPASTGLPAMDYRFTDSYLEPEDSPWSASVETPVRLPDTYCCFDPIDSYPTPGPPPFQQAGHVTFGSLNNFCKVTGDVIRVWATLLHAVERSRLLMQCPAGTTQTRVRQWFEAQGIAAHRLDLVARTKTRAEFLQFFQRIDIALDPFPYNGGTTTCEALWMGIPVVGLAGESAVSRAGLSFLANLGLPELVAHSEQDYVGIAAQLAHDRPRLAELRTTLRPRMKASLLMDAPRFAHHVEAAYRAMWRLWCAEYHT